MSMATYYACLHCINPEAGCKKSRCARLPQVLNTRGNAVAALDNGPVTPVTVDAPMNTANVMTMDISGVLSINYLGLRGMVKDRKVGAFGVSPGTNYK